jgi:hypothetical protein
MSRAKRARQGPAIGGNHQPVDVITHEAVAKQADAELLSRAGDQVQVHLPARIGEEHIVTRNTALGQVVRHARKDRSGHSGHLKQWCAAGGKIRTN